MGNFEPAWYNEIVKEKLILFFILPISFLLIGVFVFIFHQKSSLQIVDHPSIHHNDWKTFKDHDDIYSFQYPSRFEIKTFRFPNNFVQSKGNRLDPEIISFYLPSDTNHREQFSVIKTYNKKHLTLDQYVKQLQKSDKQSSFETLEINNYRVLIQRTKSDDKNLNNLQIPSGLKADSTRTINLRQTHIYFVVGQFI